jgi:opacity protein-like surface antigen
MKKLLLSALLFVAAAGQAFAADLFTGDHSPDTPHYVAFDGLAVGIHGGGQMTSIDVAGVFDGISADGLVGGVHAEYLFTAGRFRIGPWGELSLSDVNTELSGFDVLSQDYAYSGGIKVGVTAWGASLISMRAGYEMAQWSSDIPGVGDIDVGSWLLGAGVETMVAEHVSLGIQADYLVPHEVTALGVDVTSFVEDSEQGRVLARLTWRQ